MGINQDAYDFWQNENFGTDGEKEYNILAQRKQDFLTNLARVNVKYGMPVPTKKDLHNGFLREYHELNPTTQVAIKEMILGCNNETYREEVCISGEF